MFSKSHETINNCIFYFDFSSPKQTDKNLSNDKRSETLQRLRTIKHDYDKVVYGEQ